MVHGAQAAAGGAVGGDAQNIVAMKSVVDGTFLGAYPANNDISECGGEVGASDASEPKWDDSHWPGWFVLEPATPPGPGRDFWNTVGGAVLQIGQNVTNNLKPTDITTLMTAIGRK
jgi:hypothetical protein